MAEQVKRKLSAKELRADILSGMGDEALRAKHKLTQAALDGVFEKLLAAGVVKRAHLEARTVPQVNLRAEQKPAAPDREAPPVEPHPPRVPEPETQPESEQMPQPEPVPEESRAEVPPEEGVPRQLSRPRISGAIVACAVVALILAATAAGLYLYAPHLIPGIASHEEKVRSVQAVPAVERPRAKRPKPRASTRPAKRSAPSDFLDAMEKGDVKKVKRILAEGADVNQPFRKGVTPLMVAAKTGNADMVNLLLKRGRRCPGSSRGRVDHAHVCCVRRQCGYCPKAP